VSEEIFPEKKKNIENLDYMEDVNKLKSKMTF
jgi:hypothetical protein